MQCTRIKECQNRMRVNHILPCRYPTSLSISLVGIRKTGTEKWKKWKRLKNQGKYGQEGIDNFISVIGLYNHNSCVPIANFFTIICRLVVLKMWESKLWYHSITPRSYGYGDVTASYIRRAEMPSRIYAKHQYRQESEYESTVIIYISAIIAQVYSYHRA